MISSLLYNAAIHSKLRMTRPQKALRLLARYLRELVLRFGNPLCEMDIHGARLQLPLSHPLPIFLAKNPQYDSVLGRIALHLRKHHGRLTSIDIGANIGDTLAALHPQTGDWVLAVEPFAAYRTHLESNAARFRATVRICAKACVEEPASPPVEIRGTNGTGVLIDGQAGNIETITLNELVAVHPELSETHLLKIDVDGHDFSVVRGGMHFIASVKPVIFIESDIFDNSAYVDEVLALANSLERVGYMHLIVYDHQGGLIHTTVLSEIASIIPLLYYQTSRGTLFLDLMIGRDLREFFESELQFFSTSAPTQVRAAASALAAKRWQANSPLGQ